MAKRLYKSSDRKISGVCSGIAEFLNIDSTIVRLVWIVLTCFSAGTGIIAYFVCALIMPDRPSDSSDWSNVRQANEYSESDKEFDSYFKKDSQHKD